MNEVYTDLEDKPKLMTLSEYQSLAYKTAIYPNKGDNIVYAALGLGEVGEVQNQVKKIIRDDNGIITAERREALIKEVGDTLWYVAAMASELGVNLEKIARINLHKLEQRKERGTLQGSGDNR